VGEILILIGTFQVRPVIAIAAFIGVVLGVIYILRMVQDSLFGEASEEHHLWDIKPREMVILVIMALPVLYIGLHPGPVLKLFESSINLMLQQAPLLAQSF